MVSHAHHECASLYVDMRWYGGVHCLVSNAHKLYTYKSIGISSGSFTSYNLTTTKTVYKFTEILLSSFSYTMLLRWKTIEQDQDRFHAKHLKGFTR